MATAQFSPNDMRRGQVSQSGSPRPKNRESSPLPSQGAGETDGVEDVDVLIPSVYKLMRTKIQYAGTFSYTAIAAIRTRAVPSTTNRTRTRAARLKNNSSKCGSLPLFRL
jgi:hypothetical protein